MGRVTILWGSHRSLPPGVPLNYDVVFIIIVIITVIIMMYYYYCNLVVVMSSAVTEGGPLLVTSAQGHFLVGLRDKTVTRL